MQIVLILMFAVLLSVPGKGWVHPIAPAALRTVATLWIASTLTLLLPLAAGLGSWICVRSLNRPGGFAYASMLFGRIHLAIRGALLVMFGLLMFQTGWGRLVRFGWHLERYPLTPELVLMAPVLLAAMLCWLATYPADRALRVSAGGTIGEDPGHTSVWTLSQYMDFQVRYQLLTVLVPMSLFILASDLMALYGQHLARRVGVVWVPEMVLAVVAGTIFVLSPIMLRYIRRTQRLADSPLRTRLEETCRRMGLRYRQILVWQSHGAMVNAAVMGLLPQIRYILLSDGLLDHLTGEQVESVFGHEAGHVRERHITFYLLFAIASMMCVSLAADWMEYDLRIGQDIVELAVLGMVGLIWLVIFGWISRRFERQADLHGVRCLGEMAGPCALPCWLHNITPAEPTHERILHDWRSRLRLSPGGGSRPQRHQQVRPLLAALLDRLAPGVHPPGRVLPSRIAPLRADRPLDQGRPAGRDRRPGVHLGVVLLADALPRATRPPRFHDGQYRTGPSYVVERMEERAPGWRIGSSALLGSTWLPGDP